MASTNPIEFADNLIKGAVLTPYGFLIQTASVLVFPFAIWRICAPRSFWRRFVRRTHNLSATTFLFLWLLLIHGTFLNAAPAFLSQMFQRGDEPASTLVASLLASLISFIAIDLVVRTTFRFGRAATREGRKLYMSLALTAFAIVSAPFALIALTGEGNEFVVLILLLICSAPLTAITWKAAEKLRFRYASVLAAPAGVIISVVALFLGQVAVSGSTFRSFLEPNNDVVVWRTQCEPIDSMDIINGKEPIRFRLTTFMLLKGEKSLPIYHNDIEITDTKGGTIQRIYDGKSSVLKNGEYKKVQLEFDTVQDDRVRLRSEIARGYFCNVRVNFHPDRERFTRRSLFRNQVP